MNKLNQPAGIELNKFISFSSFLEAGLANLNFRNRACDAVSDGDF
ncbi:MAG: hypothetical protein JWM11_886 [Planctomycetaceae bacterium]|nr:hypothetical protein [Planctomycetaceae bacterium]